MCSKKYLIAATIVVLCSVAQSKTCHIGHKLVVDKGAPFCEICDPGTFMPEDNHNKTKCYRCLEVCDVQDGQAVNMIFNCSHLPSDLKITDNITDQAYTAPSVRDSIILLSLAMLALIILLVGSLLVKCMAASSGWLLSVMKHLADHQLVLDICSYIIIIVLIVCCLVTLIVQLVNPVVDVIFVTILLAFCFFAAVVFALWTFVVHHHLSREASQGSARSPFI